MFYHNYSYSVQRTKKNTKDMEEYGYNKKVWYIILDVQFPKKNIILSKKYRDVQLCNMIPQHVIGVFLFFLCAAIIMVKFWHFISLRVC